jgi:hypothetical protein
MKKLMIIVMLIGGVFYFEKKYPTSTGFVFFFSDTRF